MAAVFFLCTIHRSWLLLVIDLFWSFCVYACVMNACEWHQNIYETIHLFSYLFMFMIVLLLLLNGVHSLSLSRFRRFSCTNQPYTLFYVNDMNFIALHMYSHSHAIYLIIFHVVYYKTVFHVLISFNYKHTIIFFSHSLSLSPCLWYANTCTLSFFLRLLHVLHFF